jgi:hypothetical protein
MPIRQFTIGFSRTVNLGNYESARVEASVTMEATVDPATGASLGRDEPVIRDAELVLRHLLEETWKAQKQTINGKQKP